ncbi:MAG: ATPase [Thermofilum sp. ex4484_79]|nr:MAG: ATPase [Thermofilum sp. ex4484_79]
MKNKKVYIIKASGKIEEYKPEKIYHSLIRTGVDESIARDIVSDVSKFVKNGMTTRHIYQHTIRLLRERKMSYAQKYTLREAIMRLGPEGYPFEHYFAKILEDYGYTVKTNRVIRGKCVSHEIDIVAVKDGKRYLIECKYHNNFGTKTDVKVALYVYARFLDLEEYFDRAWIATNTKLSLDAIDYAKCVNMKVTAWHYPYNESLEKLIERKKLYPVTILFDLNDEMKLRLLKSGIVFLREFVNTDHKLLSLILGISPREVRQIVGRARYLVEGY